MPRLGTPGGPEKGSDVQGGGGLRGAGEGVRAVKRGEEGQGVRVQCEGLAGLTGVSCFPP